MATYSYRAIDEEGQVQTGNIDASNVIDLELRLRRIGMDLIRFEIIKKSVLSGARRISRKELITFCFHMDQLLKSGVPIIDSLTDLRDT
ncbi:MAG: type II secretion system F family protein, partial [Pseudomonadota bacterium]